jgi:hypothetical protein
MRTDIHQSRKHLSGITKLRMKDNQEGTLISRRTLFLCVLLDLFYHLLPLEVASDGNHHVEPV